jgi:isopenicillin-N epimerase
MRPPSAPLHRRELLAGLALLGGASACGSPSPDATGAPAATPDDPWQQVRGEFDLAPGWIHLGGFLLASHPRPVREAIERIRKGLDDNPVHYLAENERDGQAERRVLASAATYLGASPSEIALTDSTTMGLATLFAGLPLHPGDDVLTSTHDHYATHESLRLVAERSGAAVRKIALYEAGASASSAAMAGAVARAILPSTRVVALTWVHSSTGVKIPVRAIADVVAAANRGRGEAQRILLCIDGVHGLGVEDATMGDLGCDFFVAGTHKWLFGPRGTGLIWGREALWPLLRPTIPSFSADAYVAWLKDEKAPPTTPAMMTPGGFHSFEHRWALGEAFDLHLGIGKSKIAARIHALAGQLREGLATMPHVTLHTPRDVGASSGIVCFDVTGASPDVVVDRLREQKIIVTRTPYRPSCARAAPGLLNTPAEVETTLRAVRALASG